MRQITLALALLPLLAACAPVAPPVEMPPPLPACDPGDARELVGQSADVLAAMTFSVGTRIFRTGDALTMDFNPDRLNIEIGADDLIVAVTCG